MADSILRDKSKAFAKEIVFLCRELKKKGTAYMKKSLIILGAIVIFLLISPTVNWFITKEAFILPQFFGFVSSENENSWIGFFGSIIGGGITLIGVAWTIIDQNKKRAEDMKDAFKPIIVSINSSEKIRGTTAIECIFYIKNMGRGILYNFSLYNIICKIDDTPIESTQPSIPMLNYLGINDSYPLDIMVILDKEMLQKLYDKAKGRGGTLAMEMITYVGGNDAYGRTVATEIFYRLEITFHSSTEIDLGIVTKKLTSRVLFNRKELGEILKSRNPKYSIF